MQVTSVPVAIGGKKYDVPVPMYLIDVQRVWDALVAYSDAKSNIRRSAAAAAFVAACLLPTHPEMNTAKIKSLLPVNRRIGTDECDALCKAVNELVDAMGLVTEGEEQAAREKLQALSAPAAPT